MNIQEQVLKVIHEISGQEGAELSLELQSDLGLDSLQMVLLLLDLEDAFGIQLKESDMNPYDLVTVSDVVSLMEAYCEETT